MWVRLWSEASYLLAAEAQRKDWLVEVVSEDVFTHNDQVVKKLAMMPEKTTIKEAKQSIQCCKTKYKMMSPSSVRSEGGEAAAGYCLNSVSYRVDKAVKYNVLNSD